MADVEEGYTDMELLFLDIYMKELNGMETARRIRELECKVPIVFLTSSRDFAVESYEVHASGYLLKPFEEEKLKDLLNRILHLSDGTVIVTAGKLVEMEERIHDKRFLRCHQSYLVNMDYIADIREDFACAVGLALVIGMQKLKETC